jgi:citrate synthase
MTGEVLFTITKEMLETGLRGYPAGYCPTSYVHPDKGLHYVGLPVHTIANEPIEKVIYLLLYGQMPGEQELSSFCQELKKRAKPSDQLIEYLKRLPKNGSPLKLFASAILFEGIFHSTGNWWEDCLDIVAKAPLIAAELMAHCLDIPRQNIEEEKLGYVDRMIDHMYLHQLKVNQKPVTINKKTLELFMTLHLDHGGGNLSTFVGKAVASGLEDIFGSLASAMLALEGPRHGRANQDCLEFLYELQKELGESPSRQAVYDALKKRLEAGRLLFGFGHAVLRMEDPRATLLYDYAKRAFGNDPLIRLALNVRQEGGRVLQEIGKVHDPYPNIDAISGATLVASGFDFPRFFPLLFGAARCVGIARQIVYERVEARGGKGTPIVRPQYLYLHDTQFSG